MTEQTPQALPAGWYPDGAGATRWWDGTAWTEHVAPMAPAVVAEPAPIAPIAPVAPQSSQPFAPAAGAPVAPQRPIGQKQGAWGLWWLCVITFGIYYFIWYQRINNELSAFNNRAERGAETQWWSQLIPIYGFIALVHTAGRLNASHSAIGSPVRVGGGTTVIACFWFNSQTRYLQRRLNALWDTSTAMRIHG